MKQMSMSFTTAVTLAQSFIQHTRPGRNRRRYTRIIEARARTSRVTRLTRTR
jgi:hypothetical protein